MLLLALPLLVAFSSTPSPLLSAAAPGSSGVAAEARGGKARPGGGAIAVATGCCGCCAGWARDGPEGKRGCGGMGWPWPCPGCACGGGRGGPMGEGPQGGGPPPLTPLPPPPP